MHRTMILMLEDEGMTVDDIEFVNLSANDARTALAAKSVDAIVVEATAAMSLLDDGSAVIVKSTEGHPEWKNGSCILVKKDLADQYPEVVTAFVKAHIRASAYAADNHQDLLRDLLIRGGLTAAQADTLYPALTDYATSVQATDEVLANLDSISQFLKDNDLIPELVDIKAWYDGSFYDKALEELQAEQ
jgi:ABC-type nitrate/sulfonate/bicarbonate transport system substrate-binding protein